MTWIRVDGGSEWMDDAGHRGWCGVDQSELNGVG